MYPTNELYVLLTTAPGTYLTKTATSLTSDSFGLMQTKTHNIYFQVVTSGVSSAADATVRATVQRSFNKSHWITVWTTAKSVGKGVASTAWVFNTVNPLGPYIRCKMAVTMPDANATDAVRFNVQILGYAN